MIATPWLYSFTVMFSLLLPSMVHATVISPTIVEGIVISAADQSAQKAREKAIMAAERRGLKILSEHHTPTIDHSILDTLEESKIQESVKALEIMKEKSSKGKYVGTFKVTYKETALQHLLGGNAPIAQTNEAHCLILPLYKTTSGVFLWGDDNPWFEAFHQENMPSNLILPLGDLSDMKLFSHESSLDFSSLKNLIAHYDSSCAYVALLTKEATNSYYFKGLKITEASILSTTETPLPASSPTSPSSLGAAVKLALKTYADGTFVEDSEEEDFNHNASPQGEISQKMTLSVSFKTFEEWQQIKNRLSSLQGVKNLFVESLSKANAILSFYYAISRDTMIENLKNGGFDMDLQGTVSLGVSDSQTNKQMKDSNLSHRGIDSNFEEDKEEIA